MQDVGNGTHIRTYTRYAYKVHKTVYSNTLRIRITQHMTWMLPFY